MRFKTALLPLAGLTIATAACAPVDPGFGEALAYDKVAQTVNPDPQYPEDAAQAGSDGVHAQKATERYRKGTTKPVQVIRSNSAGGGSGSGSGSGGSGPQ